LIAYKFLREGAVGPFSRAAWPQPENGQPGEWVRATGLHACRPVDLPLWIAAELWEAELEEPVHTATTHVVAGAGRLLRRVEGSDAAAAADFAGVCAERTGAIGADGFSNDAKVWAASAAGDARIACADAACVAYIAAHAAGVARGPEAGEREREWQAAWLTARLGL